MQYLAKRLRQAGFATFAPHFKGYGFGERSDPFASGSWTEWRAQILEHFDELARNYRSVSVSGLCVGAVLALDLAAERPGQVAALSLLATTLAYDGWSLPWYRFLAPLAYYTPLRHRYSYRERHPYGVKNESLRRWIAREMAEKTTSIAGASSLPMTAVYQARKLIRHVRRVIPAVNAPALVIHAREDDVASVKSAEFVLENIGSHDVDFVLLHDSYHIVTLDNEKELVADETIRFFRDRVERAATVSTVGRTHRDEANRSVAAA
jgi:carboxylesterase